MESHTWTTYSLKGTLSHRMPAWDGTSGKLSPVLGGTISLRVEVTGHSDADAEGSLPSWQNLLTTSEIFSRVDYVRNRNESCDFGCL